MTRQENRLRQDINDLVIVAAKAASNVKYYQEKIDKASAAIDDWTLKRMQCELDRDDNKGILTRIVDQIRKGRPDE